VELTVVTSDVVFWRRFNQLVLIAYSTTLGCNSPFYEPVADRAPPTLDGRPPTPATVDASTPAPADAGAGTDSVSVPPPDAPVREDTPAGMMAPDGGCTPGTNLCPGRGCVTLASDGCCQAVDCPTRPNTTATCELDRCVFACAPATYVCAGGCESSVLPTCCESDPALDANGNNTPDCQESLIPGGQFQKGLGPWGLRRGFDEVGAAEWTNLDARGASSGSARVTVKSASVQGGQAVGLDAPCFAVRADEAYTVSYDAYIDSGDVSLDYVTSDAETFADRDCQGERTGLFRGNEDFKFRTWMRLGVRFIVPPRTQSFRLTLWASEVAPPATLSVHFDNVIVRR
jgi:hypothetical protein